jgi:glycosyltransferase involved in cell wall biosynthesis
VLSIVVLARNCLDLLTVCLQSVVETSEALRLGDHGLEYVLLDDCSDEEQNIVGLFRDFRSGVAREARIVRFAKHLHYTHGVAYGLSLARGDLVLFLSHDMALTPECLRVLLQLSTNRPEYGVIRPASGHMDGAPGDVVCRPPFPLRNLRDVESFSRYVARCRGDEIVDADCLIGDAMLISRRVLDRIGVFDTRFRGFFADVDFGLRAQRAGFRLGFASGAWLHHEGSGFSKDGVLSGKFTRPEIDEKNWADMTIAYGLFREKWSAVPATPYPGLEQIPWGELRALPADLHTLAQPPIELDPTVGEIL